MITTLISLAVISGIIWIVTSNIKENKQKEMEDITFKNLPIPVIILFAEYLGFVSGVIEWAEEWCKNDKFPEWKKKILTNDAYNLMKDIKKHFSDDEILTVLNAIHDDILKVHIDNFNKNHNG